MLTALLVSDSVCILMTFSLFSLPKLVSVSPYIIPVSLPVAQVSSETTQYDTVLSLVESFIVMLRQLSYAIKNT